MSLPVQSAGVRTFQNRDLDASDRVARHIRRGGIAILEGRWDRVLRLRDKGAAPAELGRLMLPVDGDWVRTRMETAPNDGGQQTIRRFLAGAPARLNPGGHVIVGYADHSGPKAIANLERFAAEAGLTIRGRLADRIKTHRAQRAWESIFAYDLA